MSITNYLEKLDGTGKRHVLLIVTSKDSYPTQFSREEYANLEKAILDKPSSYIDLFEPEMPEIMQFTAFRLFLKPIICDKERLSDRSITKVNRLKKDQIISFFVTKHFYNTVPGGKLTQDEAINEGLIIAEQFLEKYPVNIYDFASVKLGKDSNEANILIKLDFKNDSNEHYFDYVYIN
ncbi:MULTISPECIES: hypothetical protein [Lysinibacillus]|jgi:hypothetical protein|uniref:hypothetical protein n=1 Tax=Lysinibacillus TaxID=400634 RepID=UPI0004DAC15F|nr:MULTISPECIES: hypothetical protein [Lysinibacillus]AJK87674.1 hypothetical protein HR49_11120 [Lysinibacillus fusiformis]KHK48760.1 hypothetical protein PI85_21700 [Lysinibacillus sp. A1]